MADFYFECEEECNCVEDEDGLSSCLNYGRCCYCHYKEDCPLERHCISDELSF